MPPSLTLPLFPLPNVVHFPCTDLRLHIFEPRYRDLISDLSALEAEQRLIGMVLMHQDDETDTTDETAVYAAGTAGRLVEVDYLPDGRSNILLRGAFRFEVEHEISGKPYRQARVRRVAEPALDEGSSAVCDLLGELVQTAQHLSREMGDRFPLDRELLRRLRGEPFERVVNSFAAELDLPVLRKLRLLSYSLPERAVDVLSILSSRKKVVEGLRPFRRLAASAELN